MKSNIRIQLPAVLLCILAPCLGFFLHLQQLRLEQRADGTLAIGTCGLALLLLCALFVLALICLLLLLRRCPSTCAVFSTHPIPNALRFLAALILLVGNLLRWDAQSGFADKLLILLGVLSAVCIALAAFCRLRRKTPSPLFYMSAGLYLAIHLILSFQSWNTDPAVQDYCYALIAILCAMLSLTQLSAFSFGKGKPRMPLFWTLCSLFFCAITLADGLSQRDAVALCTHGSLLLLAATHGMELLFAAPADAGV